MSASKVTRGSGNVFADLGFEDPDEELLKAQLALRVRTLINERGLTQTRAANILDASQPDVSSIVNGRVSGFSLERLLNFVRRLGDDVEISLKHSGASGEEGRILLTVC